MSGTIYCLFLYAADIVETMDLNTTLPSSVQWFCRLYYIQLLTFQLLAFQLLITMRVLQTILCVVTVLLLEVTCHPTLDDRSLPEVPNLLDTTDNRNISNLLSRTYLNKYNSIQPSRQS
jgi:hypothetical protein